MAGLQVPLPTLRTCPREHVRTARGRCGSLLLHRDGLAPSTPCRSPGALPNPDDRDPCARSARPDNGGRSGPIGYDQWDLVLVSESVAWSEPVRALLASRLGMRIRTQPRTAV